MNRHSEKWKLPFRMPNGINGILGDPKEREQRYRKLYGKEDWEACSLQDQMELKHRFRILLIGFFAAFLICVCISSERIPVDELVRPKPGEESSSETLYLTGSFDGLSVTKELFVTVEPRQLTEKELRDKLGEYAESLPQRMLGENRSLTEVDRDLIFPETDETGEIIVRWFTDRPDLLSEEGTLYRFRAEGGETITVTAELRLGSLEREETFQITLKKAETADEQEEALGAELSENWRNWAVGSPDSEHLKLQTESDTGIHLAWSRRREAPFALVFLLFCICCALLFRSRYRRADQTVKRELAALHREFPAFLDELLLLLNAGLVVRSAFEKMAEAETDDGSGERIFRRKLRIIVQRSRSSNAVLSSEVQEWAVRSGLPELLRFSAILEDHLKKGTDIAEKLETEEALLRAGEKRRMEEQGKLVETKLAFPMMLLLGALLLITMAPMFMNF